MPGSESSLLVTISPRRLPALDGATGLPRGLPRNPSAEQVAYAERLHRQWTQTFPAHPDSEPGDVEDFWEDAARLDAALHSGAAHVLLDSHISRSEHQIRDITLALAEADRWPDAPAAALYSSVVEEPCGSPASLLHYGGIPRHSALWAAVGFAADRYAESSVFREHAGRRLAKVGYNIEPTPERARQGREVHEVMAEWAHDGVEQVVIKAVRAKHGIWRLPASTDAATNRQRVGDALGWSLIHHEGLPGAYLLQSAIEMEYEYRLFILDARPITGAGCIVEHTPLIADHADGASPFSPLVRQRRGIRLTKPEDHALDDSLDSGTWADEPVEGTPAVKSRPLVDRYVETATRFAQAAAAEGVLPRAYTLDLAYDPEHDRVVAIEVNGLSNSGLYASKPWLVTQALMRSAGALTG